MASITVSSNPNTTGDTLTVNFTTDATNITDILISKDGGSTYVSATSFTNSQAVFNVSSWDNGTYSNCKLKCIYTETSSGGSGDSEISTESGTFGALLASASTWYVIGDSISDTALSPQTKYMTVLGNKFSNLTINNVGKDGSHFTNKTTGYSTFATLLAKLPSSDPSVITIFGGVNDYIQSCTIGDISSTDTSNFYGALNDFVTTLNNKYTNAKKLFIIPLNMRAGVFSTNSNGTNSLGNTLQQYRDAIIAVCKANNIEYIDLHEDTELQPDLISSDGLHPTQDGHKLLASKLSACKISSSSSGGGTTETYTTADIGTFSTVGKCSGISIDSSGNLTASTLGQWGMVKLDKTVTKLKFTVRDSVADYGALCWYIYNDNGDGTYNMIALGNISGGENGKRFKMTIPGTGATQIDKLEINTINPGETLTIEIDGNTQTIYRQDGSKLVTLTGNMSAWCGQSSNSSPFCSNIQYISGSSTIETLTISDIGNITQPAKTEFYIAYSTNIAVVKHEVSWDGGSTFYDKTEDVIANGTSYKFKHDNKANAGTYNMAIRVTTAKGTTKTSNVFTVTLESNSGLTFTQYKKLDNGVITDTTDEKYYSTVDKIAVTPSGKYTLDLKPVSYVCVCFYNSSDTYLGNDSGGYVENHTSNWSVGSLSTTINVPASASYIRICGTSDNTQVTGTLIKSSSGSTDTSGLLDSDGAYVIDDFSGSSVDPDKWGYELGYVRNNETQRYTNTNAQINDGILALRGLKDSSGNWTSASIISKGHFAFMYGKIVARVRACNYNGAFGAFWTLGDSFEFGYKENGSPDTLGEWWAYCGEFDVMEFYNGKLTCGTFFNEKEESGRVWYNNYPTGDWHEFAMEWNTDGSLIFSIDGHELSRTSATDNRAFHIPHFILLNQAIGASGGTPDSSTTEITQYVDWIKYYPLSTDNVVLNSSDFSLTAMDWNDSAHNCMVRPTFNDNCINKSITWQSSNTNLVTCHSGLCASYAGANGEVIITGTSHSGISKQITLTVKDGVLREKTSGGGNTGTPTTNYTVTYNLNDSTSSNNTTSVEKWSKYSTNITANNNYTIKSINVIMNGDDYSSKYVTDNKIDIPLVTGDIYITIVTETSTETQVTDVIDRYAIKKKNFYITYTTNKPVKEHFVQWGNTGYHEVTKTVKSFGNKHILLCDNAEDQGWKIGAHDVEVICKDETGTYAHSAKFNVNVLDDTSETFTITNNLSNAINGNNFTTVPKNSTYSTLIIPNTNYSINNITVTMGGVDISSSCVNNENINIPQVTGNISITASTTKVDSTIYTNPAFSVKDFKIVLSENGHTEEFNANYCIDPNTFANQKEVASDMSYYMALVPIDTGSKFRVNGLYPYSGGHMVDKTKNDTDYTLLTDYSIPIWTYTNWNFSYGIKNAGIEDELLNKSIHAFNTALPAFNVYVDNTSTNTIIKDSYSDSWYGQTTFMSDHFEAKINEDNCLTDYGGSYGDSTVINNRWISTVAHEIGHTVGIMDNPNIIPSLYCYNRNKDVCTYLQATDIYTLKYLYIKTYGIDISKSQEEITAQATKLGLINKANDMPMTTYSSRPSCQICFDYNYYDKNELEDKSDVIVEGQLNFKEVRTINIGKDLNLEYNVYTISANNIIKSELTNMELKIHVSQQLNIDSTNTYRLYLKQYDNVPCSLINPNQGIEKI